MKDKFKKLYLDSNAHMALKECALKEYIEYQTSDSGHGHPMSPSGIGRKAELAMENARSQIANLLGARRPSQIIFTSTCTQAAEWAVKILKNDKSALKHYVSPIEHSAVREAAKGFKKLAIAENGVVLPINALDSAVACIHVHNETGVIQPINDIKAGILFSDLCQSVGKTSINLEQMGIDIAVFGAHKFGGPASVGILYLKDTSSWRNFDTGSRYSMDRAGTPDVASIVATAKALEDELFYMPEKMAKAHEFQTTLEAILENNDFEIISKNAPRVCNTTFLKIPKPIAMELVFSLSSENIFVGLGSACGSLHTGATNLMVALNREEGPEYFIRISTHGEYGKDEAEYVANRIVYYYRKI